MNLLEDVEYNQENIQKAYQILSDEELRKILYEEGIDSVEFFMSINSNQILVKYISIIITGNFNFL